jgi:hypothetical protein
VNVPQAPEALYHLELRKFPHNLCHFNLTAQELRATILEPWVREEWIELGERKWNTHQAKLTVIEGPRLELGDLSMGRGWQAAQREGRDVTAQLLETVTQTLERQPAAVGKTTGGQTPPDTGLLADSLGLELLSRIGAERTPLRCAWDLAAARHPNSTPSQSLAIAERAVAALLRSRLIMLLRAAAHEDEPLPVAEAEIAGVLGAVDSWTGPQASVQVWIRRA